MKDYTKDVLVINDLCSNPIEQFESGFLKRLNLEFEANALVLSTISESGTIPVG